jgi:hypothetical protein
MVVIYIMFVVPSYTMQELLSLIHSFQVNFLIMT